MKKPLIGIVGKTFSLEIDTNVFWELTNINSHIRYSLIKNGADVLGILPQSEALKFNDQDEPDFTKLTNEDKTSLKRLLMLCDGIVFQGGLSSASYEEYLASLCYELDIPTLGICAGQSTMLRSINGSAKKHNNDKKHNQPALEYVHKIFINEKSNFYKIVKCKEMMVNSIHSYSPCDIKDYIVSAYDDDNNIEVVENPNKTFHLAMRFHPELLVDKDEKMNSIFKAFVEACKAKIKDNH